MALIGLRRWFGGRPRRTSPSGDSWGYNLRRMSGHEVTNQGLSSNTTDEGRLHITSVDGLGDQQTQNDAEIWADDDEQHTLEPSRKSVERKTSAEEQPTSLLLDHLEPTPSVSFGPADFKNLKATGSKYDECPAGAKEWLTSFGVLRPGTDVSLRLFSIQKIDKNPSGPSASDGDDQSSLLPLLNTWLISWFTQASIARQKRKDLEKLKGKSPQSSNIGLTEDKHLKWLLKYIHDYITMLPTRLEESDVIRLAGSLLALCTRTRLRSDLDGFMKILYTLYSQHQYPEQCFERTIAVLSGINAFMTKDLPKDAQHCIDLTIDGVYRTPAINVLYRLVKQRLKAHEPDKVNMTRGALMILLSLLNRKNERREYVVCFSDAVEPLVNATENKMLIVNVEVLMFCCAILEPYARLDGSKAEHLALFTRAVTNCATLTDELSQSVDNNSSALISSTSHSSGSSSKDVHDHLLLAVTQGLIKIFLHARHSSCDRLIWSFESLVKIASPECQSFRARIAAMKLLFRIRCDVSRQIFVARDYESDYIAVALCRTANSAAGFPSSEWSTLSQDTDPSQIAAPKSYSASWIYPDEPWDVDNLGTIDNSVVVAAVSGAEERSELPVDLWLEALIKCLQQKDNDWEVYSFILVHFGAQLANVDLFAGQTKWIMLLSKVLCGQIRETSFHVPPTKTGLNKSDVAICIFNVLTPLITYAKDKGSEFARGDCDGLVLAFIEGIAAFEGTARGCIHSLWICCLQIPDSVNRYHATILDKMAKNISQSHLAIHILEYLAGLARLSEIQSNFPEEEVRKVFGICIRYLEIAREARLPSSTPHLARAGHLSARTSGTTIKKPPFRAAMQAEIGVPQYVYALAYHVMIFWFLSLKLGTRSEHVSWIIKSLIWKNSKGEEIVEERSQVFIDMMLRATYSDLGETSPHPDFARQSDGIVTSETWLVGLSILSIETAGATGSTQITKRQASGTTHSVYKPLTAELPAHHAFRSTDRQHEPSESHGGVQVLPSHVLLQLVNSAAPMGLSSQPLYVPKEDFVKRALTAFDRTPTVDGYKMGVIYIGPGETQEAEILARTVASTDFRDFLEGLGTRVPLLEAKFNTQGLAFEIDGDSTYAWRDRVTELVFHIPSMMPTDLEDDPNCNNKKRHIGNDHVNIIFNRSGLPFRFDTFRSQFNYVNIVITPASPSSKDGFQAMKRHDAYNLTSTQKGTASEPGSASEPWPKPAYYKVHVLTAPGFPTISPASDPKVISKERLPDLVREIGLNACIFSQAWLERDSGAEQPSSWGSRRQQIIHLRDRVIQKAAEAAPEPVKEGPLYAGFGKGVKDGQRKTLYPEGRSALVSERRVVDYNVVGEVDGETLSEHLDFSKWTL